MSLDPLARPRPSRLLRAPARTALRALAAAAALAAIGCDTDFDPQYRVTDLRLLAVRSAVADTVEGITQADALPGDTLVLEALVANPRGRAPLTVAWYGCPPRADEALPPCLDREFLRDPQRLAELAAADAGAPSPRVVALGAGEAIPLRIPRLDEPDPLADAVEASLQFVVRRAVEDPTYRCFVYAELPVVAVAEADGLRQLAVKRVRVTPSDADLAALGAPELAGAYVRNLNPAIAHVVRAPAGADDCAGGAPVASGPFPPGSTVVCGMAASASSQSYDLCGPEGPERTSEDLEWQWYLTAGELPEFEGVGNATSGSVELVPPSGPFTLWTILRDGRGGEAWTRLDLVAP